MPIAYIFNSLGTLTDENYTQIEMFYNFFELSLDPPVQLKLNSLRSLFYKLLNDVVSLKKASEKPNYKESPPLTLRILRFTETSTHIKFLI